MHKKGWINIVIFFFWKKSYFSLGEPKNMVKLWLQAKIYNNRCICNLWLYVQFTVMCFWNILFGKLTSLLEFGVWSLQKLHKIRKYLTFCCSFLKLIHKQECTLYIKIFFHKIILTFIEGCASNFTTLFNSFHTLCLLK